MKKMKRLASLLLALAMAFGLTATALAAETTDRVDVNVDDQGPEGHTYTAYQILKGTLSEREGKEYLVDIEWGDGVNWAKNPADNVFLQALKGDDRFIVNGANIFAAAEDAEGVAKALNGVADKDALAKAFANVANTHKAGSGTAIEGNSVSLSPGYYLLVDSTGSLGGNDAYNSALLQVTKSGGITIEKKYSVPTVDKSVKATGGEAGEAADAGIGDSVTFTLKGTLPENYDDFEEYTYQFTDTLSAGLDYQEKSAAVKLYESEEAFKNDTEGTGGTDLTGQCTFETAATDGETTLTWTFADLKTVPDAAYGNVIVVTYKALLNSNAEVGSAGNPNKVTLTYSNNPNHTGIGTPPTGITPPDEVLVFTYEIDGEKVDGEDHGKKLEGAEFILYRGIDGAEPGEDDADGNPTGVEYALVDNGKLAGWTGNIKEALGEEGGKTGVLQSNGEGKFVLAGLDQGIYYLKETKAPAGYNLLKEPIKMEVTATLTQSEDNPALEKVTIKVDDGAETDGVDGVVSLDVENSSGVLLPSTGGMGTTLFYIAGVALVLAAGILLVLKRRTNSGE